jgi:hypothetical protein
MKSRIERIMILCKTYPSPSSKYAETSCVAGMLTSGELVRLYPVPFRLVSDEKQFRKWEWIEARIERAPADRRPESHRIYVDTINCEGEPVSTKDGWRLRRELISRIPIFNDFDDLEEARKASGITLALLRPNRVLGLEIKNAGTPDWTDEERAKLLQSQRQGGLFDDGDPASLRTLRKLPHEFHYRYECTSDSRKKEYRHKIVDWEAGALYWNVQRSHGPNWEAPFRSKLECDLPSKDLMFLMGTIHRFPDQWLIVSLIYPPKPPVDNGSQGQLF